MKEPGTLIATIRKNIIDTLMLLSSREKQNEYPVPVEWICLWFDDFYHPKDKTFKQSFTTQELDALSKFSEYFETVVKQIGDLPVEPSKLWNIPVWQVVMDKAIETLAQINNG